MSHLSTEETDRLATSDKKMEQLLYALLHIITDKIERGSSEAEAIQTEAFERVWGCSRD